MPVAVYGSGDDTCLWLCIGVVNDKSILLVKQKTNHPQPVESTFSQPETRSFLGPVPPARFDPCPLPRARRLGGQGQISNKAC